MIPYLFAGAAYIFAGYIIGKLFKGFNPFLVIIGGVFILSFAPLFLEAKNQEAAFACALVGVILNFDRPVTKTKEWIVALFSTNSLRRVSAGYAHDIADQVAQAEAELEAKKKKIEEELRRQQREAEEEISRQKRAAEEELRRQAENLRREQERARQEQARQERQRQSQSRQDSGQNSSYRQRKEYLNPREFEDACEILGMGLNHTLKEYKRAYKKLISQSHADKLSGLSEGLKRQEEEKAKMLNIAMATIEKTLKSKKD